MTSPKLKGLFIPVSDLNKSTTFYTDTLNLQKTYQDESMSIFSIGSASYKIDLLLHINNDSSRNISSDILIDLQVDDLNEVSKHIGQSEGKIIKKASKTHWDTFEAVIADPDGYQITLSQPLN